MRFVDLFDRSAERYPQRICATDGLASLSYAQAHERSLKLASRLIEAGLAEEAKVGILCPNLVEVVPTIVGVLRSGCTWLPVNPRNSVDDNLVIMRSNDCEWLLYAHGYEDMAEQLVRQTPTVKGAVCIDRPGRLGPGLETWTADAGTDPPERGLARDHCFKMALSGGTTGAPKGVMHTNLNVQIFIASLSVTFPFQGVPSFLCVAPVTHAAGNYAMWILALGGTLEMMDRVDPGEMLRRLEQRRISATFAPPTLIYALLEHPEVTRRDYSALQYFFYGAAPISADKLRRAIEVFGMKMAQVYSLAEATMAMVYMTPSEHDVLADPVRSARLRSAGRAAPYTRIAILREDGAPAAVGETGEIAVRGEVCSRGYYKQPEATRAMYRHGWLMTSDLGYRDDEGFIYLVDRKRDMIISGGFNVYPSEVERALMELDAVLDAAVVGAPDEKWGEAVTAVVVLREGHTLDADAIVAHCKARIGSVKAPKRVEFRPALPKSANGKVLKRLLRDEFWAGRKQSLTA